jgi:hypothetical protein
MGSTLHLVVCKTVGGEMGSRLIRASGKNGKRTNDRGQTTLDFAIGISIFLTVLLFNRLSPPGILSPFTESAQAETVSSNRVADQLAKGTIASCPELSPALT